MDYHDTWWKDAMVQVTNKFIGIKELYYLNSVSVQRL